MKRTSVFTAIASVATVGLNLDSARAQQDDGMGMGGGKGIGHGMMGSDKGGRMMGRGGMMGMMGGGCPMMGMMMGGGDMPMYAEGRVAFLKAELAITDAEAKVWDTYADALRENMKGMQGMHKTMMSERSGKTPVERVEARITMMEGRLQALKKIKPALTGLYDAFSDDQKKKADELLTGMGCMM